MTSTFILPLKLAELPDACPALARNHVANNVDAASVMLDEFHDPPKVGILDFGREEQGIDLHWDPPSSSVRAAHANERHATEDGAYAVAFAVAIECGYQVRRRAHHGSGSDYLLTRVGEPAGDLVKLEVSGVARGSARLRSRLHQKMNQLERGDLLCPGLAVVVGFESARVLLRTTGAHA